MPVLDYYPMLAGTGTENLLDSIGDYRYEPKLDGVRCLAYITHEVKLFSRVGKDITDSFPDVVEQLSKVQAGIEDRIVLDGEIIVNPSNIPNDALGISIITADFQALQHRLQRKVNVAEAIVTYPATFVVFDILEYAGLDVTKKTYDVRRILLTKLSVHHDITLIPSFMPITAKQTYHWAIAQGCEGFMAKKRTSLYYPSIRSKEWLKIKPWKHIDCYAIGATYGYGRRDGSFGALVLAEMQDDFVKPLTFIGLVGTGFNDNDLLNLQTYMQSRRVPNVPCRLPDSTARDVEYYTTPFKVRIKYQERTKSQQLRFPVYECVLLS